MNYSEARQILEGRKARGYAPALKKPNPNRNGVKLANNTYLERRGPREIALRFHSTDVLLFTPNYVEMTTGGWPTMSTRDRLSYGPMEVAASRGRAKGWHVYPVTMQECYCVKTETPGLSYQDKPCFSCGGSLRARHVDWESGGYPFYDGIRVRNDGAGILRTQPNRPQNFDPLVTESGFTGPFVAYGFAASRQRIT